MKIFKVAVLSVTLLTLSGCGLFGARIEDARPDPVVVVNKTLLAYTCPQPPQVDNVDIRTFDADVISRKELDAMILELLTELDVPEEDMWIINQAIGDFFFLPDEDVIWAYSVDDYAALGKNTSDVIAAIRQMKAVAIHYKKCIADSEAAVLRHNAAESDPDSE